MANVDKTVTNIKLVRETGVVVTPVAFTSDTGANDTETLIITPTGNGNDIIVIITEVSGAGPLGVNIAAGDYWAGKAMAAGSVAASTSEAFIFQAAAHKDKDDNTIKIVVSPHTGEKLVTNSAATWQCFQMPPASLLTGV